MTDQRLKYTEELVGSGHPTKADALNRLALVSLNPDGTLKSDCTTAGDFIYFDGSQLTRLAATAGGVLVGGAAPWWLQIKGFLQGFSLAYNDDDTVDIAGGTVEINGDMYDFAGASIDIPAPGTGPAVLYLCADPPASGHTLTSSDVFFQSTKPTWSGTKRGYYDGSDVRWLEKAVVVDSSWDVIPFYFSIRSNELLFQAPQNALDDGMSETYANVTNLAKFVPNYEGVMAYLRLSYDGAVGSGMISLRTDGLAADQYDNMSYHQNESTLWSYIWIPVSSGGLIEYKTSNSLCMVDIDVMGFRI